MLITADVGVTIREAAARFNTLLTAAVAGLSSRPNKHPMEKNETKYLVWHFIATLVCIHLCFWHRKQCLPLMIPQGQWWHKHTSYNTMGTVETNIQELWYHRDSGETYDTTGTVLRQWWWHKIFLMTKIHDKRCQNISNKDTWQKVSNNLIKSMEWETIQHYGCQFIFGNVRLHPNVCVDIYNNIHGDCPDIHWRDDIWPLDTYTWNKKLGLWYGTWWNESNSKWWKESNLR